MSEDELDALLLADLDFEVEADTVETQHTEFLDFIGRMIETTGQALADAPADVAPHLARVTSHLDEFVAEARARGYNDLQVGALAVVRFSPTVAGIAERAVRGDAEAALAMVRSATLGVEPFQVTGTAMAAQLA